MYLLPNSPPSAAAHGLRLLPDFQCSQPWRTPTASLASAQAQKIRIEYANASEHVINRGNYRRDLFAGEDVEGGYVYLLDKPYP